MSLLNVWKIVRSQIMVSNKVIPNICFRRFIQLPGRGREWTSRGKNAVKTKGKDKPSPMNKKVSIIMIGPEVNAKARAVPINGAVQGVAKTVAKTPLRKSPSPPDVFTDPNRFPPGVTNS